MRHCGDSDSARAEPMNIHKGALPAERFRREELDALRGLAQLLRDFQPEFYERDVGFTGKPLPACFEEAGKWQSSGPFYLPVRGQLALLLLNGTDSEKRCRACVYNLRTSPKTLYCPAARPLCETVSIPAQSSSCVIFGGCLAAGIPLEIQVTGGVLPTAQVTDGNAALTILLARDFMPMP